MAWNGDVTRIVLLAYKAMKALGIYHWLPFRLRDRVNDVLNAHYRPQCQLDHCRLCGRLGRTRAESRLIDVSECCEGCQ